MNDIVENIAAVRERIRRAALRAGRDPNEIVLVAVSKLHGPEAIRAAYAAGLRDFGENYVQELVGKATALTDLEGLRFHFIGHLQRNKAKAVRPHVALVESVDSERLADALDRGEPLAVYLQVNIAREPQKSGCTPEALPALVAHVRQLPGLRVEGLMTVPPADDDPEASRRHFRALRELATEHDLNHLSMGMSHDLEVAIEEGATSVRVGTAIFGARP